MRKYKITLNTISNPLIIEGQTAKVVDGVLIVEGAMGIIFSSSKGEWKYFHDVTPEPEEFTRGIELLLEQTINAL